MPLYALTSWNERKHACTPSCTTRGLNVSCQRRPQLSNSSLRHTSERAAPVKLSAVKFSSVQVNVVSGGDHATVVTDVRRGRLAAGSSMKRRENPREGERAKRGLEL